MYIYIRSMSESQSRIYDRLSSRSWEIDEHIVKLLLLPDCQEANHWKREIIRFVDHVDKLKGKNKFPDAKFIKKCLSTHNDMTAELLSKVRRDLHDPNKRIISPETALHAIEDYQTWVASELSVRGVITYDDAYEVIDHIIETYSH